MAAAAFQCRSFRRDACVVDACAMTYSNEDFQLTDSKWWSKFEEIFSTMCAALDGVNASVADREFGRFHYKSEYLRLQAMWSDKVNQTINFGVPYSDSWLLAIWLYVSGCPSHIIDDDCLLLDVSNIVQKFSEDVILAEELVRAMEGVGYRRPFARIVAMYLSVSPSFEFADIIRGIAKPVSANSFLCGSEDELNTNAFFRTSLTESADSSSVAASEPSQCFISVAGYRLEEALTQLIAKPFQPTDQWRARDFARHTYHTIADMLTDNPGHYVLGHVTSEQCVIDMCIRDNIRRNMNGISVPGMTVLAGHRNSSSCGHGMYFFQISQTGDFDTLSTLENVTEGTVKYYEFQSFLYALTRAFDDSAHNYHLAPAVLLLLVPNTKAFTNAYSQNLPLLDAAAGGCSCQRRYKLSSEDSPIEFQICYDEIEGSCPDISRADAAAVLRACLNDPAQLNAAALRFGLVNLQEAGAFEAIVSDGSVMTNIKNFIDEIYDQETSEKLIVSELRSRLFLVQKCKIGVVRCARSVNRAIFARWLQFHHPLHRSIHRPISLERLLLPYRTSSWRSSDLLHFAK